MIKNLSVCEHSVRKQYLSLHRQIIKNEKDMGKIRFYTDATRVGMPFINIKTNAAVSADKEENIKSAMGQAITAIPGKSESWLMVGIEPEYKLWFKGTSDPAAMVQVSIYGTADRSAKNKLTGKISEIIGDELGISPSRIYVSYTDIPDWGWNGANF